MGNFKADIEFMQHVFKKYKLMQITTYAKLKGVTRTSVYRWMAAGKVDYIVLGNNKFIIGISDEQI